MPAEPQHYGSSRHASGVATHIVFCLDFSGLFGFAAFHARPLATLRRLCIDKDLWLLVLRGRDGRVLGSLHCSQRRLAAAGDIRGGSKTPDTLGTPDRW